MEYKCISIDTSKHMFTLHGIDEQDRVTLRRELRRGQVEAFFAKVQACPRSVWKPVLVLIIGAGCWAPWAIG